METNDLDAPTEVVLADNGAEAAVDKLQVDHWPEIGGYELLRELGRGGMGVVYLARHLALERLVALKTIPAAQADLADVLVNEARIVGKLEHPAIVPVYEVNLKSCPRYFSMGFVDGQDLARSISRKVLTPVETIELSLSVCDAVAHAHAHGVLHLDIKPANILLDRQHRPKLTDFGLSAIHVQQTEGVYGTPQFMAPEQALGQTELIAETADVYSIGAVMYAALAGRPPLVSSDPQELVFKVASQRPPPLRQLGVKVSPQLEAIIFKCLAKQPHDRYSSANELKCDLMAYQAGEPIKAKPASVLSRFAYLLRRHVLAASVSGSAALLLLLLVVWVIVRLFAQSMQLTTLTEDNEKLRQERQIWNRQLASSLTEQQRQQIEAKVARDLAMFHADKQDLSTAAGYAAKALLIDEETSSSHHEEMLRILDEFAEAKADASSQSTSKVESSSESEADSETRTRRSPEELIQLAHELARATSFAEESPSELSPGVQEK